MLQVSHVSQFVLKAKQQYKQQSLARVLLTSIIFLFDRIIRENQTYFPTYLPYFLESR